MKYRGSKRRFADDILSFIPPAKNFVEPFVGGANLTKKIDQNKFPNVFCYDINKHVIAYFKALQQGWLPEKFYSEEFFNEVKKDTKSGGDKYPDHLKGYLGFTHTFQSSFFEGFARAFKSKRDFSLNAYGTALKDAELTKNFKFSVSSYEKITIPENSVVYCDPPYSKTVSYFNDVGKKVRFDSQSFWNWVRETTKYSPVFVSEQEAPDDFICIWEKEKKNMVKEKIIYSHERLFVHKSLKI